ncbi:RNA polymerase sigma factor [Sphingomonas sp. DT-204]|uniref:RNA polymerase sigma factor n=1 Tax=Sphingomonas sp. DT-204 TaxID=3396166 RepID=UPI003F1C38F6
MPALRPIDRWFVDEVLPHESRYIAVARRLTRNPEEAEDLVQESLARLLALDGWSAIANPPAYVIRAIHNIAIERMRRAKVVEFQQLTEIETSDLSDEAPDPFRVAAGRDSIARLHRAVDALPDRCKTVFVRRRIRDQSPGEIASDLGISLSTFEKRLARAMYLLARAFDPGDKTSDEGDADLDGDSRATG